MFLCILLRRFPTSRADASAPFPRLKKVHHHCPGVPCLIVGTQVDLRDDPAVLEKLGRQKQRPVPPEAGERLARELGAVKYVECSALTQKGVSLFLSLLGEEGEKELTHRRAYS